MQRAITFRKREDGVGVITIDVPGEAQNTIKSSFKTELPDALRQAQEAQVKAIILTSSKPGSFLAGADIEFIKTLKSAEEAARGSRQLQAAFDELENSSTPFVAAIDGACLGGGLEIAMACAGRVATDNPKTRLGLPEVQLGVLPGAGGTQRLPRLVGVEAALDLMLTGKQIDAKRAQKMGLVDEVVPPPILEEIAAKHALALAKAKSESKSRSFKDRLEDFAEEFSDAKSLRELALAKNPAGRNLVFSQAEKTVRKKAGDHYEAPYKILEAVKVGLEKGMKAGLVKEAELFGQLAVSPTARRLIEIFFATTALKKDNGTNQPDLKPQPIDKIGVLGAGLMGHGISFVTAQKAGIQVRMRDREAEAVGQGLASVRALFDERVKKRRMTERERDQQMMRVSGSADYSGFADCDVVIEAVFEDLSVKHQVLAQVEEAAKESVIFASNTSSIPITKIAEPAKNKANVVGMHYFSPVHKMPLLEIIRTEHTSDQVIATVVDLGKKQGKTVIVVNDGVGFYTSRILGPYMNEAAWMLSEGIPVEVIDEAAVKMGFPVGPITLLDEVGIDTAAKVSKIALEAFGDRMNTPGGLDKLVSDGRTGRKGKKGFYTYDDKKKEVDESVYGVLGVQPDKKTKHDLAQLGERLILQMVSEAVRCLEENILRNPRDGDIGAIFGLGFPPFLGGPFRYVDNLSASQVLRKMGRYADRYGKRFATPELLTSHARSNDPYHKD